MMKAKSEPPRSPTCEVCGDALSLIRGVAEEAIAAKISADGVGMREIIERVRGVLDDTGHDSSGLSVHLCDDGRIEMAGVPDGVLACPGPGCPAFSRFLSGHE